MLGFLIVYGTLAAVTGVAIATCDDTREWDPWTDDTYPF